jgi:hypothetical protein
MVSTIFQPEISSLESQVAALQASTGSNAIKWDQTKKV